MKKFHILMPFRKFIAWLKKKVGRKVVIITKTIITFSKIEKFVALMKIRVGVEVVKTAGTTITFSSELPSSDYVVFIRCFGIGGNNISFKLTNKIKYGFKITPVIDSTIEYIAIPIVAAGTDG